MSDRMTVNQTFFYGDLKPSSFCWAALEDDAIAPSKTHESDAGWDLAIREPLRLGIGEMKLVDLGLAVAIPVGYVGLVYPRSSMGVKFRVGLANTVGVIDADYRGPIKLALQNFGSLPVDLQAEQRVAQMVLTPCLLTDIKQVEALPETARGQGGFGSTGT